MEELIALSQKLLSKVEITFHRSLMGQIDWNQRLIEIRGSRGVGKTTLMLQRASEINQANNNVLYASLDTPYFFQYSLFDLASTFSKYGGNYLFLDEVHRYPSKHKDSDWSLEIKNIHDAFPELYIVYSGSSILHLHKGKGDLSRRKASYSLPGLSFREYLEMNQILKYPIINLENILDNHSKLASEICQQVLPLPHFKDYIQHGYYPFYSGNDEVYIKQLQEIVNLIIDTDLTYITPVSNSAREQLKRLLGAISTSVPYVPNMNNLAAIIDVTDHRTLMKYMLLLHEAQLINLVRSDSKGNKILQKPDKILMHDTNIARALCPIKSELGTIRETFFYNQLSNNEIINYSKIGDFKVNNKYTFEVGGKTKTHKQIQGVSNAYVVADEIEIGFGTKIPLWLFGFLY